MITMQPSLPTGRYKWLLVEFPALSKASLLALASDIDKLLEETDEAVAVTLYPNRALLLSSPGDYDEVSFFRIGGLLDFYTKARTKILQHTYNGNEITDTHARILSRTHAYARLLRLKSMKSSGLFGPIPPPDWALGVWIIPNCLQ